MVRQVKIFVRDVYFRTVQLDVNNQTYNIALYSPQACLTPEDYFGHDILHCYVEQVGITEWRINIDDDPGVVIYDTNSLMRIQLPKIPTYASDAYQPESNEKLNRYQILDIRRE